MVLNYKRSTRVAELIQQEVSKIVQELKDPEKGFITITGVKLTEDLKSARIFFSVIGNEQDIKKNSQILNEQTANIRHLLAVGLNLKYTPVIAFEYDETPAKASRIFEILEKIKEEGQ
jgi:ribosome-binding factor A